jgi:3-deoxy-D-manno-octulosonate 8-phosphate phosphatase (KDO 8-P phosphatase)
MSAANSRVFKGIGYIELMLVDEETEMSIEDKLKQIKLLALDCDGVLTYGEVQYTSAGEEIKTFNVHDGLGLQLLKKSGVSIAIITGRESPALARRAQELHIDYLYQNCKDKLSVLQQLAKEQGLEPCQVGFMGDDLPDIPALHWSGVAIAVKNAHACVYPYVDFITQLEGGKGAVREVCDFILKAKGELDSIIHRILGQKEYVVSK